MKVRELTTEERERIEHLRENIAVYKASIAAAEYEISRIEFNPQKEAMDEIVFGGATTYAELAF